MPRPGYLNLRITPSRRSTLDTLAYHFARPKAKRPTDQEVIDFALVWTLTSVPERFTNRAAASIIRHLKDAIQAGEVANAHRPLEVHAKDLGAVSRARKGS